MKSHSSEYFISIIKKCKTNLISKQCKTGDKPDVVHGSCPNMSFSQFLFVWEDWVLLFRQPFLSWEYSVVVGPHGAPLMMLRDQIGVDSVQMDYTNAFSLVNDL